MLARKYSILEIPGQTESGTQESVNQRCLNLNQIYIEYILRQEYKQNVLKN